MSSQLATGVSTTVAAVSARVAAASSGCAVSCGWMSSSNLTCRGRPVAGGAGGGAAGAGALQSIRGTALPSRVHTKTRCAIRAQPGSDRQRSCAMWQQGHAGRTSSLPTIRTRRSVTTTPVPTQTSGHQFPGRTVSPRHHTCGASCLPQTSQLHHPGGGVPCSWFGSCSKAPRIRRPPRQSIQPGIDMQSRMCGGVQLCTRCSTTTSAPITWWSRAPLWRSTLL